MRPIIRTIIIQTAQDITSAGNLLNRCGLLAHTLFVVGEEGGVHTQQAYFFFFCLCKCGNWQQQSSSQAKKKWRK